MFKDTIKDVPDNLTELEREVIEQRFGLKDGCIRTREEVGRQFQVTRERIRQIEGKALRKMRHLTRIRKLEGRNSRAWPNSSKIPAWPTNTFPHRS